jgi:preprotein translocase subunit SecE
MGEASATKVGFFKGVRTEFKKIIWPNQKAIVKNTYVVILVTLILGSVIALIDAGFQFVIFDLILGNL